MKKIRPASDHQLPTIKVHRAATALSDTEHATLERLRGPLDVSTYLRWLIDYASTNHIGFGPGCHHENPVDTAKPPQ